MPAEGNLDGGLGRVLNLDKPNLEEAGILVLQVEERQPLKPLTHYYPNFAKS
ncbi:MAG: hypothetical protein AAGA80_19060 [Cyanobacteria bacterium P01_F01_bin.143]